MKHIIGLIFILFTSIYSMASHIVGGEIYYDYLGNNNYRISIAVFRDCESTGAPFDNPLPLTIFTSSNVFVDNISVPLPLTQVLPVVFNNPCVTPPSGICVERAIYTTIVNLPPTPGGYTLSYQRCCRGPNITNLNNPDDTGLTLTTKITGTASNALVNSSPRFQNYPPLVLCNNDDLIFNHSATDPDGDELVYELITPLSGGTSGNPAPPQAPPPPYNPVSWTGGFGAANPLGPGATININPTTGLLTADPEMLGLFVVGIRVKEYRNGVLIGQTDRDFLFKVVNCIINLQAEITPQEDMTTFVSFCQGRTITFDNQSFGGSQYQWDFGVPGITTDVSTQFEPTYTFPDQGIYEVTLVVNPGWPCTDTSKQTFHIFDEINIDFSSTDEVCLQGNSVDFNGTATAPASTIFSYNFGPNANPSTGNQLDFSGVNFTQAGNINVELTAIYETCTVTVNHPVIIFDEPKAEFELPASAECGGLSVNFVNISDNASSYSWDFGVLNSTTDVSTLVNPTFTYPEGGTYTVQLVTSSNAICQDTFLLDITVNEALNLSFTSEDSLCVTDNSFTFVGNFSGPPGSTMQWNFGPNASIPNSTDLIVPDVVFNTSGVFPVTFSAEFGNCSDTYTENIHVLAEPTIDFTIADGLQCAPYTANFINLSTADSPMTYLWDFGDGNTSNVANPIHVYPYPGNYDVTLTISTSIGCIATLTLTKENLIQVKPSPEAKFMVTPDETNICEPIVSFIDQSIDGYQIQYIFDDLNFGSNLKNPTHKYSTSGTFNPIQIATNEYLCSDTTRRTLVIYPNEVFIPNTFTPDGNEFNGIFNAKVAYEQYGWQMRIYNRWGQLIFESSDPNIGWDGTFNGTMVQSGLYTYRFSYISCENEDIWLEENGHVNLMR